MYRKRSMVLGTVLFILAAAPLSAQGFLSLGPTAGVRRWDSESATFLNLGLDVRVSPIRWIALHAEARYAKPLDSSQTFVDLSGALEVPILLGIYAKAGGGALFEPGAENTIEYWNASLGFSFRGLFIEATGTHILEAKDGLFHMFGATAGIRFKLF